jgi:hypothetical protein
MRRLLDLLRLQVQHRRPELDKTTRTFHIRRRLSHGRMNDHVKVGDEKMHLELHLKTW